VSREQGKGRFDWLQKGIKDVASATSGAIDQVTDLAEKAKTELEEGLAHTMDRSLRLAVTGLSRSGKTVFTVSLVHLLKHLRTQPDLMRLLGIAEVVSVRIENTPALDAARFPYEACIEALSEQPPAWPAGTSNVSEVRITLEYRPVEKSFVSLGNGTRRLYLDIIDYPGEWLLDLPLLNKSYAQWSQQTLRLLEQPARAALGADWRAFAKGLDPAQPAGEAAESLREGARLFRAYLLASRRAGLQFIQPGRFIMPGDLEGKLLLQFFPLLGPDDPREGTLLHELERRYRAYCEQVVGSFHKQYFAGFDRQVVLADLLTVLNNGEQAFADTREALHEILENFRYGESTWRARLFKPRIDRVLLAATKADRVSRDQSPLLLHLLEAMFSETREAMAAHGRAIEVRYQALSALCCTRDVKCKVQGVPATCIQGTPLGESALVTLFPGQVPSCPPADDDWVGYQFRDFTPPSGGYRHGQPMDHLKMHAVLKYLLGDKL